MSSVQTTPVRNTSLEITSIHRIATIPIVEWFLELSKEKYAELAARRPDLKLPALPEKLKSLPEQAKLLSDKVLEQARERATPYIAAADAWANSRLDRVQDNFFVKAPAPEVLQFLTEQREEYTEKAKNVFEEKVKIPAIAIAKDLDQRSKPIVDYAQARIPAEVDSTEFQYQRALGLGKVVTDQGVTYSTEQLKQLQERNALVARGVDGAKLAAAQASAAASQVQPRLQELKERYGDREKIRELTVSVTERVKERVQTLPPPPRSLEEAKELSLKTVAELKERAQQIPPPPAELVEFFTQKLPAVFAELKELAQVEAPLKEKVPRLGSLVVERFTPEAELIRERSLEAYVQVKARFAPAATA